MRQRPHVDGAGRYRVAALVVAIAALSLNLRPAVTSLPPIFPDLRRALSIGPTTISLLSAAPLLCFAAFSGLARPLSGRFGEERVLGGSLAVMGVGLLVRGQWPREMLFPATVLACGAIAQMNDLLSSLIKRREPRHAGALLGCYLLFLYVGSIFGSALAVPVFRASHGSANVALGLWALPVAFAILCWLPQMRHRTLPDSGVATTEVRTLIGQARAWQVCALMGLQSTTYYASASWLPTMFRERGATALRAGFYTSLLSIGGLASAFVVPIVAHRLRDQRVLVVPMTLCGVIGVYGTFFGPLSFAVGFSLLLGFAQGAAIALALYIIMARSPSSEVAASMSAMAQGFGYLFATGGPLAVGLLHEATGSWRWSVGLLLSLTAAQGLAGLLAGRPFLLEAAAE